MTDFWCKACNGTGRAGPSNSLTADEITMHIIAHLEANCGLSFFDVKPEDRQIITNLVNLVAAQLASTPEWIEDHKHWITVLSDALKIISKNTCCDNCREAVLVARSAIASYIGLAREISARKKRS